MNAGRRRVRDPNIHYKTISLIISSELIMHNGVSA